MPPRIHARCSTWGDPKTALAPQKLGDARIQVTPRIGGRGGRKSTFARDLMLFDPENMSRTYMRIEFDVVIFTPPGVLSIVEQIVKLVGLVRVES